MKKLLVIVVIIVSFCFSKNNAKYEIVHKYTGCIAWSVYTNDYEILSTGAIKFKDIKDDSIIIFADQWTLKEIN